MGMSVQQVIEAADKRTERRASKELDLTVEFWMALNEFCIEKHFPWRRSTFFFNTTLNGQFYDMSSAGLSIAPDFYEMITLYRVDPTGSATELTPMLDEDILTAALENPTPNTPSMYYIKPGTTQTLMLNCQDNAVRKIRGNYWAVPDPIVDSSVEFIPLVPPQITPLLVVAMERRLFDYLYGQQDPRSLRAEQRYRRAVALASRMSKFTTNAILTFATQDQAIRAVDASTSGLDNAQVSRSD